MDAPVIPDHRPYKAASPSVLSCSPTIVLDDYCDADYPDRRDQEFEMRPKFIRTQSFPEPQEDQELDARPKPIRTQSHGDRELVDSALTSSDRLTPVRIEGEQR